jgi:hypothetical protein
MEPLAASGPVKPWSDTTPGSGTRCFITGQAISHSVDPDGADLDGRTTLTSPRFDATGMIDPVIGFWRWFYSRDAATGHAQDGDGLTVLVSADDGATWVAADTARGLNQSWEESFVHLGAFVTPGAQVRVRFVALDGGSNTTVEAGIDDVTLYDAALGNSGVPDIASTPMRFAPPWPNPSSGVTRLALALPGSADVTIDVVDVRGRVVRRLHHGPAAGGLAVGWDGRDARGRALPSGVYFAVAHAGSKTAQTRIVRVH